MKTIFEWTKRNAQKLGIFGSVLVIVVGIIYGVSKIISAKKAEDAEAEEIEKKSEPKKEKTEVKEKKEEKKESSKQEEKK